MSLPVVKYCPSTLAEGFDTYSRTGLNRVFRGKKVSHILPHSAPTFDPQIEGLFEKNRKYLSLSGIQEKFSVVLDKNKLRLPNEGERSNYILKPIPNAGKKADQMPANEHLTMQIARQVYGIETAENALIFFKDGSPAYITKRFDVKDDGSKLAQEDFALDDGLLPRHLAQGKISQQFAMLAEQAEISQKKFLEMLNLMLSRSEIVEKLVGVSFLNETTKRNYLQSYQGRLKQLAK